LKFADYYGPTHALNGVVEEYIKNVETKSNGRLKIERYPAEQLGKANDMLNLASTGTADIAMCVLTFFQGQVPLTSVANLPHFTTAVEGTEIMIRTFKESPEIMAEFAKVNTIPINFFMTNQLDIGTAKKQVKSPEDLKGLKIGTSGGLSDLVCNAYGAIPVNIATNENYEAIQKGILDGTMYSLPSSFGMKLMEVEKYHTFGMRAGGTGASWVMNLNSYNSLPEDLRKVLAEVSEDAGRQQAKVWDQKCLEAVKAFEDAGMTVYTVKDEERAKWDAPVAAIDEIWLKQMNDKGLPAQEVLDLFSKIAKEETSK